MGTRKEALVWYVRTSDYILHLFGKPEERKETASRSILGSSFFRSESDDAATPTVLGASSG
jgi:hypothetical protein